LVEKNPSLSPSQKYLYNLNQTQNSYFAKKDYRRKLILQPLQRLLVALGMVALYGLLYMAFIRLSLHLTYSLI